jgi:hypothetical protein
VESKSLSLNEKELHQISTALKASLERQAIDYPVFFNGTFECPPKGNDCSLSIDTAANLIKNGLVRGNDLLNGIANGNGNENGNNNGNLVLQIFNIPVDDAWRFTPNAKSSTATP